jgi:hypothetical protein
MRQLLDFRPISVHMSLVDAKLLEIDVKFGKAALPNVGFSAVDNKVPLEVTAKLVHDFVADKALEIGYAREAVVVVI